MATDRHERIARNESAFRKLNESLQDSVHRTRTDEDLAGFVCECGDSECEEIVRLRLSAFEEIRQDSQLFFVVPGHEIPDAEDVVDDRDGYLVVRKHEDVAEMAEQGDLREPT
jgi:hypothetical protein